MFAKQHRAEYDAWRRARDRCENPSDANFADYGGRGLTVSPQWATFAAFYQDMGPRPSPAHSLDRKDNSRGYSKGNCRWATKQEQAENRRSTVPVGDFPSLTAAAKALGMHRTALRRRLARGWSLEQALTLPPAQGRRVVA